MKQFAALYHRLDRSTGTLDKRAALINYFQTAPAHDAAWALYLLCGGKIAGAKARIANGNELRAWAAQATGLEDWLVADSHAHVGDLAETLALLFDEPVQQAPDIALADWIEQRLLTSTRQTVELRQQLVQHAWCTLPFAQRLVFNKLLTGSLRVGVSQRLVQQALTTMSGLDIALIAQRMLGHWQPTADTLHKLLSPQSLPGDREQPYPFYLASPLQQPPPQLGAIEDWLLEWKWDGIRLQLLRRDNAVALWSRGEERLDGRFPEIEHAAQALPEGTVIDGELLAWQVGEVRPLAFTSLQARIQRRKPGRKILIDTPVRVLAYDLLELDGQDLRQQPLRDRRRLLADVLATLDASCLQLSPALHATDWDSAAALRAEARARGVEGLMLKRAGSPYQAGRRRGDWWKWKLDPLSIDAVLLYAQAGHGRRSTLYTDYTFGLWNDEGQLVPVAKAYSGLDDAEIAQLDRWIRAHTTERFGPVRALEPLLVFELGFEGVNPSKRHKSGVAVRFPRVLRWRHDKLPTQADSLASLQALAQ